VRIGRRQGPATGGFPDATLELPAEAAEDFVRQLAERAAEAAAFDGMVDADAAAVRTADRSAPRASGAPASAAVHPVSRDARGVTIRDVTGCWPDG
jgi:hypothetical protein